MKVTPKEVRVYSSVPFLQGNSPAELVMGGANPDAVFNAQEEFKDRNRINDDGTKYLIGGEKQNRQIGDSPYEDPTFVINKKIDLRKNAGRATGLNIGKIHLILLEIFLVDFVLFLLLENLFKMFFQVKKPNIFKMLTIMDVIL